MDWTQALTVIGVFVGGFIYLISKMDANQKENNARFDTNQKENNARFDTTQKENNLRFNGIENRLTAIEIELKNTNQRLSSIETENKDISKRLSNIEGYLSPKKVFHFKETHKDEEEPKEN